MTTNRSEYHKRWRHANPERTAAWRRSVMLKRRANNKVKAYEHFGSKCGRCGEWKEGQMHFDHIDPETKKSDRQLISNLVAGTWARLQRELPLVQLLCRDCHRLKTSENKDFLHRRRESLQGPPKPRENLCACGVVIVTITNKRVCDSCLYEKGKESDRKYHATKAKNYPERTCLGCPATFKPRIFSRLWCSKECRWKNQDRVTKGAKNLGSAGVSKAGSDDTLIQATNPAPSES